MAAATTRWAFVSSCSSPEIDYDKVEKVRGMEMIFVTTAQSDEECKELLHLMGMPFTK